MAITNAQQYKQLVNPPLDGKRPGYRGDAAARSTGAAQSGRADPGAMSDPGEGANRAGNFAPTEGMGASEGPSGRDDVVRADTLRSVERASVADLKPYVVEIESEGLESLIDVVRKAESQSTDYKAELLAELRAEYESESKLKMTQYAKPVAIGIASVLGLGFLWRMR